MENTLTKHMQNLNLIIEKINLNEEFNLDLVIILPLLNHMINNNLISNNELEKLLSNKSLKIKKLKFYKFTDFINISDKIENYLSELTDEIITLLPENIDVQSIEFILYEILINIYKHSKFKNTFLQIITYNNGQNIDICIFDDGIGIPGSFKEAQLNYEIDSEAIYESINGKTTDKEKYNLHGRGLNSTARITTQGLNGEMLIASGEGFCTINKNGVKTLTNKNKTNGTFIILRFSNNKIENIYTYLKFKKINEVLT